MIQTFENFNNNDNHIKYLCDCGEKQCPVCLEDIIEINTDYEDGTYIHNFQCDKCNFEWKKFTDLVFGESYDNAWKPIKKDDLIPEEYRKKSDVYLNDGNDICPFCGSEDTLIEYLRRDENGGTDEMSCDECDSTWNKELKEVIPVCIDLDTQNIVKDKLFKNERNKYTPLHFKKLVQINKEAEIIRKTDEYDI